MKKHSSMQIPVDVPSSKHQEYSDNYNAITHATNRLMLFACDQKIEHLNEDFYGPGLDPQIQHPTHLFSIAAQGEIGAFAIQPGLFARYARQYPTIPYILKLNSKTSCVPTEQKDPFSNHLWTVEQVIQLKQENPQIPIYGVGCTIYLGSEYESTMLQQAAEMIFKAHQHGLITLTWIYPRGKSIKNAYDGNLAAGAAGVANALGADFVKIMVPHEDAQHSSYQWLATAVNAAGSTGVICSGGSRQDPYSFLKHLWYQIHEGSVAGAAVGRNIFQHPTAHAIAMTRAISALIYDDASIEKAYEILQRQ